jgi:hypothetical protein
MDKKSDSFARIKNLFKNRKNERGEKNTSIKPKIIRPKDYSDEFAIIQVPKIEGVRVFDTTRTQGDYQNDMRALRVRFGSRGFMEMAVETDARMTAVEEQRAKIEENRLAKAEAEKTSANTPFNRFMHALKLKPTTIDPLTKWTNGTSTSEKIAVLQEFENLKNHRGLPLNDELVTFGVSYLLEHIHAKI